MSGAPTDVGGEAVVRPETSATDEKVAQPETVKTEAEGAEAEAPEETPEQADQREKKKREGGWQRKIRRLESDVGSIIAERDRYKALAENPQGQRQAAQSAKDETAPKRPRLESFTTYEEYEAADRAWVADTTRRETLKTLEDHRAKGEAEKAETEARERRAKARETFEEEAEKVAEHYEGFEEFLDDLFKGRHPIRKFDYSAQEYAFEDATRRPELLYHLHANPDVADKIAALRPSKQIAELARLEASLAKPGAKSVTKAPPPPKQVGAKGGPDGKDPEKMSIEEMRRATGTSRRVDY